MALREARVSLQEAEKRALAGRVESQDSQVAAVNLFRLYGIGSRSSSPVQPLPLDEDWCQNQLQAPRPPKVHQGFTGQAMSPPKNKRTKSKTKSKSKSTKSKPKAPSEATLTSANPRGRSKKSPTTADQGPGKGSRSGSIAAAAAAVDPELSSAPARATDASSHRVSDSHHLSFQQPTPPHHTAAFETAPPARPNKPERAGSSPQSHPDDALLDAAALAAIQTVNPAPTQDDDEADHCNRNDHSSQEGRPTTQNTTTLSRPAHAAEVRTRKMESSSQSPTQSNHGRSYEQYEQYLPRGDDLVSSDPIQSGHLSQSSRHSSPTSKTHENISLEDDDTGAVEFDFSALAQGDTQVSVPDSLRTIANPETPAPPKNPFARSRATLMPSSQMFTHTQFSSAYKTFSPTSSRPSPDNIHLNTLSSISPNPSPTKRATLGPSPLQGAPSSYPPFPIAYDTSPPQAEDEGAFAEERDLARKNLSKSFPLPAGEARAGTHRATHLFANHNRKSTEPAAMSEPETQSDEDISDEETRRRRHHRRLLSKAAASRLPQPNSLGRLPNAGDEIVVPSTTREEEVQSAAALQYLDQCEGFSTRDSQNSIDDTQGIEDSQVVQLSVDLGQSQGRRRAEPEQTGDISSNEAMVPNTDPGPFTSAPIVPTEDTAIPETSPAKLQPRALGDMMPTSSEEVAEGPGSGSFAKLLASSLPDGPQTGNASGLRSGPLDPEIQSSPPPPPAAAKAIPSRKANQGDGADVADSPSPAISSSPPAPAFSTRSRLQGSRRQNLATAPPTSSSQTSSSVSPLSKLTTTPTLSDEPSLSEEEPPHPDLTPSSLDAGKNSPAVAKAQRRKSQGTALKKGPQTSGTRYPKGQTRQSSASDRSGSTDELARSPPASTPIFERSTRLSRLGKPSLQQPPASRETSRGGKIFAGMSFAISFQSKQQGEKEPHYGSRIALSSQIANKIKQGGGRVLADGFEKLFDVCPVKNADRDHEVVSSTPCPDDEINLAPAAMETGFTALIADGHSRKVKYMQALALGLPCIHERWITTCMDKQRLVDWSDYLLCAGNSSFLGDAIRSRNLAPYDAASAKLSEVIEDRPRLLARSRILLVMSRADEGKKAAYVFLARVLGASLSRVYNLDEARKQLKAREDAGHPYDWVYVDEKMAGRADLFADSGLPPTAGKKRKRKSGVDTSHGPAPKRIRTLSDELVIQSLILGRLMEEEEMT